MPTLTNDGPIWTLDLGSDENRFSPTFLEAMTEQLNQVTSSSEPAVLVTTGTGKFYSNGLDLDWLQSHPDEMASYVGQVQQLLAHMLTLPVPTVAAVNGHAFGAGAMLAMAHDFRVMRTDRGYVCFPEVDIHIPFTTGMAALIQSKISAKSAVESMTTGRRYGGPDALAADIVDAIATEDELLGAAVEVVASLAGKDRTTLGKIKSTMFATAVDALRHSED